MRRHRSTGICLVERPKQSPVPRTEARLRVIQLLVGMLHRVDARGVMSDQSNRLRRVALVVKRSWRPAVAHEVADAVDLASMSVEVLDQRALENRGGVRRQVTIFGRVEQQWPFEVEVRLEAISAADQPGRMNRKRRQNPDRLFLILRIAGLLALCVRKVDIREQARQRAYGLRASAFPASKRFDLRADRDIHVVVVRRSIHVVDCVIQAVDGKGFGRVPTLTPDCKVAFSLAVRTRDMPVGGCGAAASGTVIAGITIVALPTLPATDVGP